MVQVACKNDRCAGERARTGQLASHEKKQNIRWGTGRLDGDWRRCSVQEIVHLNRLVEFIWLFRLAE